MYCAVVITHRLCSLGFSLVCTTDPLLGPVQNVFIHLSPGVRERRRITASWSPIDLQVACNKKPLGRCVSGRNATTQRQSATTLVTAAPNPSTAINRRQITECRKENKLICPRVKHGPFMVGSWSCVKAYARHRSRTYNPVNLKWKKSLEHRQHGRATKTMKIR